MTEADAKIQACLAAGTSFLVDAGAGSGKTTSLIRALDYIRKSERGRLVRNGQRVACITFTNVAKNEIIERTDHDTLFEVSTIHDFLWSVIKGFQKELRCALIAFNADLSEKSRRKVPHAELDTAMQTGTNVIYSDRGSNFLEGRIFHDDLLGVARVMFQSHPLLSRIVAAQFPFIFVDEYQDTDPQVVAILTESLLGAATPPLVAFFGDKVQSIYPDGVGELSADQQALLVPIQKEENYRCSKAVITLLNKIRSDIQQAPAGENLDGAAVYVSLSDLAPEDDIVAVAVAKAQAQFGWTVEIDELKVLFLTHRIIARKAGYEGLWSAYNDLNGFAKERFQSGEDPIAGFLAAKIDTAIALWSEGKVGATIELLDTPAAGMASSKAKAETKAALDRLLELANATTSIGDVLTHVRETGLFQLLDDLELHLSGDAPVAEPDTPEARHQVFITTLLALPFREVRNYRAVLENNLPYSTKHGVKGDEFQNVLVVLDDTGANWNQYSFGNLLAGTDKSQTRLIRTRNLFYVCCSRAKDKLIVAHVGKADQTRMEALFGADCITS